MILDKIRTAIETVTNMSGISRDDIYEIDSDLDNLLLKYVNINAFSKFRVANNKEDVLKALDNLYHAEQSVGDDVGYIVKNVNSMRDFITSLKDMREIYEVDTDKVNLLITGAFTGEQLSTTEAWYTTLEKYTDKIKGTLTPEQQERLDIILESKEKLPYLIFGCQSFYNIFNNPDTVVSFLEDTLKEYENLIVENPLKPNIFSTDLIWLTQHKQPLNLTVGKFILEIMSK